MLMKQKLSLLLFGAVVFIILSCRDEVFVDQTNERTHSNVNLSNGTVYMPNVLHLQLTEEAADTINPQVLARKMGRGLYPRSGQCGRLQLRRCCDVPLRPNRTATTWVPVTAATTMWSP